MAIKSPAEIALLRESCVWGNLAHTLLQRYTRPGVTETDVERRASNEATSAMLDAIGPRYRAQSLWFEGALAAYRGQIGRNAAIPHAHGEQHRLRGRRRARHRRDGAGVGLPLGARADDGDRAAVGRAAAVLHAHGRAAVAGDRDDPAGRPVRGGRPGGAPVLRRAFALGQLAASRRARDRAALPRGAVPRSRRPDRDPARDGVHRSSPGSMRLRLAVSATRTRSR